MQIERHFLLWGLSYAVVGMLLGIHMASSGSHVQHVTHAHILLVGFVVSVIYAVVHKLWVCGHMRRTGIAQLVLHQAGAAAMVVSLFMLYGGIAPLESLEPVLAGSSIAVLSGAVLMLVMAAAAGRRVTPAERPAAAPREAPTPTLQG